MEVTALKSAHGSTSAHMSGTHGSKVRFWFEDNGIGIKKEYQERIWGLFQKLNRGYEGTGLGLAIVRKAADRMGGSVGVKSEPGVGSRFWLEFKASAGPAILSISLADKGLY